MTGRKKTENWKALYIALATVAKASAANLQERAEKRATSCKVVRLHLVLRVDDINGTAIQPR